MKQKIFLTKNNDLLNVMFCGTPCSSETWSSMLQVGRGRYINQQPAEALILQPAIEEMCGEGGADSNIL